MLVWSKPLDVVAFVRLSRATYRKMVQHLFWDKDYNAVAIPFCPSRGTEVAVESSARRRSWREFLKPSAWEAGHSKLRCNGKPKKRTRKRKLSQ